METTSSTISETGSSPFAPDQAWLAAAVVEASPEAIVVTDPDGLIRLWNHGAERMFGFAPTEALGQSLDVIIPEKLRARHWKGYDQTMATGSTRYGDKLLAVPALHRDGRRISVEFTIVPIRDAAGAMTGMAAILRDVTARFEEMRALRRRAAATEQAS